MREGASGCRIACSRHDPRGSDPPVAASDQPTGKGVEMGSHYSVGGAMRRALTAGIATVVVGLAAVVTPGLALAAAPLGQISEFSGGLNAGSHPVGIAPGADGNVWFADNGSTPAIGRITPSGQITEFTTGLSQFSQPIDIAPGADGNLWFTDSGGPRAIGRITPSGQITEFAAGLSQAGLPGGIALGSDGNVWFTDRAGAIGRVTPSGQITEFSTGLNPGSVPSFIAPGADGNLWFTDSGATKAIGEITPSGQITEFSAGLNPGSVPDAIAPGIDGNVWFTDAGSTRAIGRITPDGQITEFSGSILAESIAPGPDGEEWFGDVGARAIGRITTSGQISEYPTGLNPRSFPAFMSSGPDGNVWFTDVGDTAAIGRIGTGSPSPSQGVPAVIGSAQVGTQQVCAGDRWADWAGVPPAMDAFGLDGYQWLLDGTPLVGQTSRSYTPTGGDVGHQLTCRVTVTYPLPLLITASATSPPVTVLSQSSGPAGATGTTGPRGQAGPQGQVGPQGSPGQVELVTCKTVMNTVTKKGHKTSVTHLRCATRLVGGAATFTTIPGMRATLSRDGVVYATGTADHSRFVLRARRMLSTGPYLLTLQHGRGHAEVTTHRWVTIR
jgi:streptogramin lyase